MCLDLLVEHVRLHLVHHGRDLHVAGQGGQMVGVEVADTDGADLPLLVGLLQGAVCAVAVAERLVQQHQVNVVRAEPAEALVDGCLGFLIAVIRDPDLRHDEDLVARDAALGDSGAYAFLVMIRLGGIDHTVAHAEGVADASTRYTP